MISSSASWNPLSSLLTTLNSGAAIVNISQNFINWSSNVILLFSNNEIKMIDATAIMFIK